LNVGRLEGSSSQAWNSRRLVRIHVMTVIPKKISGCVEDSSWFITVSGRFLCQIHYRTDTE
jgi:hypothetical protein